MKPEKKNEFEIGLKHGYEKILNTIQSQAIAFQIGLEEIGFNDFEKFNKKSQSD